MKQNQSRRTLLILLAAALTVSLLFMGCSLLLPTLTFTQQTEQNAENPGQPGSNDPAGTEPVMDYLEKALEIRQYINRYYIGDVDEKAMGDAVAAGMIEGLGDEWSYYISAEDYAAYEESAQNAYVGIGVTITTENEPVGVRITDVVPESPAYKAGLEIGDLILAVEGTPILDGSENAIDMSETKNRVRGKEGTDVTLTVSHEGVQRDVTITRSTIKVVNVTSERLLNGLYYIHIRNFEGGAAEDTIAAIRRALDDNAAGIVFDVRFNPGGFKHELVEVLDYILPEGPLFRSVDYQGKESVDYSDASCIDIPMAVLVNYDSYSAAEFFAAALQEYGAAKVVGEQTYGKGRFQTTFRLSDGSAINMSIGQYTTPNGVSLVGKGITPDYPVEITDEEKLDLYYSRLAHEDDAQLQKAVEILMP